MADNMEVDTAPSKSTTVEKGGKKRFEVKKVSFRLRTPPRRLCLFRRTRLGGHFLIFCRQDMLICIFYSGMLSHFGLGVNSIFKGSPER